MKVMEGLPDFIIRRETGDSSWFGFSMILSGKYTDRRIELVTSLTKNSIAARPIVAGNFARNPVIKHLPHTEIGELTNADRIHFHELYIGIHHYEMNEEFELLENSLKEFLG